MFKQHSIELPINLSMSECTWEQSIYLPIYLFICRPIYQRVSLCLPIFLVESHLIWSFLSYGVESNLTSSVSLYMYCDPASNCGMCKKIKPNLIQFNPIQSNLVWRSIYPFDLSSFSLLLSICYCIILFILSI